MFNFFDTLFDYIKIIWTFFLNMINGLFTAFSTLLNGVTQTFFLSVRMPWFLTASVYIAIFVVVINYIIGRDNS